MKTILNFRNGFFTAFRMTVLLITFVINIYSQDYEPAQYKAKYKGNDTLIDVTKMPEFQTKDKFVGGLHWGSTKLYVKNNKFTNVHIFSDLSDNITSSSALPDSCNVTINVWKIADHWDHRSYLGWSNGGYWVENDSYWNRYNYAPAALGVQYEPSLLIDSTFTLKTMDTTRSIFGFEYLQADTVFPVGNVNYDRFGLKPIGSLPRKVLENKWMTNILENNQNEGFKVQVRRDSIKYVKEYDTLTLDTVIVPKTIVWGIDTIVHKYRDFLYRGNYNDTLNNSHINGDKLYLSVNLRALNNNGNANDKILGLRLRYVCLDTNVKGYIKFDSIPKNNLLSDTFQLKYNRGTARKLIETSFPYPDTFFVRKGMLKDATSSRPDITLSAHFELNPNIGGQNKYLKNKAGQSNASQLINSLQVEVIYMGVAPVAIDWIRLETKHAQFVHRGYYDSTITAKFQHVLDTLTSARFTNKGIKFTGIYTRDEPPFYNWSQIHYFTKLLGNIATFEGDDHYWKQQKHYFNKSVMWGIQNHNQFWQAYPYNVLRKLEYKNIGQIDTHSLGYQQGYTNEEYHPLLNDSASKAIFKRIANSDYETYLGNVNINSDSLFSNYQDTVAPWLLSGNSSFQTVFQARIHSKYQDKNNNSFLFDGTKWWSQTNLDEIGMEMYDDPLREGRKVVTTSRWYGRKMTGDELSMTNYHSLFLGSKGLVYDGEGSSVFSNAGPGTIRMAHGGDYDNDSTRGWLSSLTPEEYIYSDSIGSDFLVDSTQFEWTNLNKYVNFEQYQKNTKTSKNRVYLGRKSMRTTVYKIHRWVRQNESLLMRLQLQTWYGKGFKYNSVSSPTARNISLIIDTANIKTRKLFNITDTTSGLTYVKHTYKDNPKENHENHDSSFYDVTVLLDTNITIDSVFYVGVLNRRTDPLILIKQKDSSNTEFQNFYFASTAEYDEGIKRGNTLYYFRDSLNRIDNTTGDTTWWRDKWWKRNGAREITIPFKYRHPTDTNNYRLLEIEEIADTSTSARNIRSWTNTSVVKTVIGQDGLVKLKMLPGEGKLLKVRVIQPSNNLDGILDYSNQNKLICMKSLADTSKIRYYATYYKHDTINNIPINRVYFASSQTISKEAPTEQIQWNQPPILLNEYIEPPIGGSLIADRSCDYPSIVSKVINDSLINHYLVFQCKGEITNLSTFIEEIIVKTIRKTTPFGIREFDTLMINNSTYLGNAYYQDNFSRGVTYKDYGNPVISAIDSGVVVAWSSSEVTSDPNVPSKILIRYHDDDGINSDVKQLTIDHNSLLPQFNGTNSSLTDFRHPSMNSYSLNSSFSYRNYSTLVWQQINPDDITNSYISMTHIKLDGGNLVKYLPRISDSYFYNLNNTSLLGFGNDTSIIQFRWGARAGNLPAVYKTYGGFATSRDYLVWERHWSNDYIQLYGVCINNFIQTNPAYSFLRINQGLQLSHSVTTGNRRLSLPNMGTPSELLIGNYNYIYNGNSANLNFNYNDKMLHTSFLGNTIIGNTLVGIDDQYIADKFNEIATGIYSHLSNSPFNNTFGNTWRNRRIFNDPAEVIKTSARYFYKTNNGGTEINKFVGFANDTSKFSFCDVFQNGNYLNLNTNSTYDTTFQETDYSSSDSIYSDWFTVGTSCNVEFIYKAVNYSGNYHVYIQRRDSNSNTTLTMVPTSDNSRHVLLNLINGNGHEYRLCVQSISNAKYLDEVVFGSLNGDTLFLKGSKQDTRTISLSQGQNIVSKVYPNPASEELFVEINKSYDRVREMTLELYDQVGKLYQLKTCRSGEKVKIDIQNYPKGSYYLNLKGYLDGSETSETIKFEVVR